MCLQNLLVSLDKAVLDPADMVHFVAHSLKSPLEAATPLAGRLGEEPASSLLRDLIDLPSLSFPSCDETTSLI